VREVLFWTPHGLPCVWTKDKCTHVDATMIYLPERNTYNMEAYIHGSGVMIGECSSMLFLQSWAQLPLSVVKFVVR
jgi:hypothetical protein